MGYVYPKALFPWACCGSLRAVVGAPLQSLWWSIDISEKAFDGTYSDSASRTLTLIISSCPQQPEKACPPLSSGLRSAHLNKTTNIA